MKIKELLKRMTQPIKMPFWWQDVLFALPRIFYGYLLTTDFGASKFGMPWTPDDRNLGLFEVAFWFPKDVAEFGGIFALFPIFFAWMGAFSEAVGGLFLMFGFQTRLFSFLIICTMLVAIFGQQAENGLWNMLPALGILFVYLFTLILGSGRFGLDYLMFKKKLSI